MLIARTAIYVGTAYLVMWSALGRATELLAFPEGGDLVPGQDQALLLVLHDQGRGLEELPGPVVVDQGTLLGVPIPVRPGRWRLYWRPPEHIGPLRVSVGSLQADIEAPIPDLGGLRLESPSVATAGSPDVLVVRVLVPADTLPEDLQVAVSEGRVEQIVAESPTQFVVHWRPSESPFARPAAILVRSKRDYEQTPVAGTVLFKAYPSLPVQTDPGVKVRLEVGRRSYGPFVAGPDGIARAMIEVRPGESTAKLSLEDLSGAQSTSLLRLGGDLRPILIGSAREATNFDPLGPAVDLFALGPDGRAYSGQAPSCRSSRIGPLVVYTQGGPWFKALVPRSETAQAGDQRIDCDLGWLSQASVQLNDRDEFPHHLVLRVLPQELEASLPEALVQGTVENRLGERLIPDGLRFIASHGQLTPMEPSNEMLRASYDGQAAIAFGGDSLELTWQSTKQGRSTQHLIVDGYVEQALVHVWAQALDAQGAPLVGQPITLRDGPQGQTDESGRVHFTIPRDEGFVQTVELLAPGARRRGVILAGDPSFTTLPPHRLHIARTIPIFSGQVRSVFITSEPGVVELGGAPAKVVVRLSDASGNPVAAELRLEASHGTLSQPRVRLDGSYEAEYSPDSAQGARPVQISASSPSGAFLTATTEIEVLPKELRLAPGLQIGWLWGAQRVSGLFGAAVADFRLPAGPKSLMGRFAVGAYTLNASSGQNRVHLALLPVFAGVSVRRSRWSGTAWVGAAGALAPFNLGVEVDGKKAIDGLGMSTPGVDVFTGAGWKVLNGELQLELGWLFLTIPAGDVSIQGSVGGLHGTLGYRLYFDGRR